MPAVRWKAKDPHRWRNRFAFLPVRVADQWIWWEWFKIRPCGEFYEVWIPTEWPHCCDQMRGEMWIDGELEPEWCPVHSPRAPALRDTRQTTEAGY